MRHEPLADPWSNDELGRRTDPSPHPRARSVAVIGGGPAGLMAAEALSADAVRVDVFDGMPSVGRKFLLAGKGGLNITHSEPHEAFAARYGSRRPWIEPMLREFGSGALRDWVHALGVETFVGSSGRVFPQEMKAAPLLRKWLHRLRASGVRLHMRHRWIGWDEAGGDRGPSGPSAPSEDRPGASRPRDIGLRFRTPDGERLVRADAVVLALGGASWPRLGSDAAWVPLVEQLGVRVRPLRPANCGFDIGWSEHFRSRFAGRPVKSVTLSFTDAQGAARRQRGEFVVTDGGIEGSLVYAFAAALRDHIDAHGHATAVLDLLPDRDASRVLAEIARPGGTRSLAHRLRGRLGLEGVKAGLLREVAAPTDLADPARLAATIKALPLVLRAARPVAEAISTAGGVPFEALDERLMVRTAPGVFCAGEMLDWEAPTGGYLLSACFASGRVAARGALDWVRSA